MNLHSFPLHVPNLPLKLTIFTLLFYEKKGITTIRITKDFFIVDLDTLLVIGGIKKRRRLNQRCVKTLKVFFVC